MFLSLVVPVTLASGARASAEVPAAASGTGTEVGDDFRYREPLYACTDFDPGIPHPDTFLGFPLGSRPCRHEEVWRYLEAVAASSPRAFIEPDGETYEGRRLGHVVISSRDDPAHVAELRRRLRALADPRLMRPEELEGILRDTPAVCWMGYCVHGDELSGTDAALALAYELTAGADSATEWLLDELVVIIDPLQNPDGRERFLTQITQWQTDVPNPDYQAMHHAGFWPWGRGNHYLFDLNRDWFSLVHPETRGKAEAIVAWSPQVVVDAHEMGALGTYLFSPPREPFHPNTTEMLRKWRDVFAADQAAAFDEHGWSYYTGEWNEEWYPGYGSSWAAYLGAVGILYEQAGVNGTMVKQPDGTVLTYRESVHHQLVSSRANLRTAAEHRRELLRDFHQEKKRALEAGRSGEVRAFLITPGSHPERAARLADCLLRQGIEVERLTRASEVKDLHDYWGDHLPSRTLPAGTYMVSLAQPMRALAKTILEFDPRMSRSFLEEERRELEKKGSSRLYETTAWSLPMAYGLETYWTGKTPRVSSEALTPEGLSPSWPRAPGSVVNEGASYGYLIEGSADASVRALALLLERGVQVRAARKEFVIEGKKYEPGSLLLRRAGNAADLEALVAEAAEVSGVTVHGVNTAKSSEGPDLGGGEFGLLASPRIGMFAGPPTDFNSFGALWWLLDQELGVRASPLDINQLHDIDLSKYNVLVMPSVWGGPSACRRVVGTSGLEKLTRWVDEGGTLITLRTASAWAADTTVGLSQVRQRRQALDSLAQFTRAFERERAAEEPRVDSVTVWEGPIGEDGEEADVGAQEMPLTPARSLEELAEEDKWIRRLRPRGAIVRARLDPEHWLSWGIGDQVPVSLLSGFVYLSRPPIETPARLAGADSLRLSGLMWPEARERWAHTAYATREAKGKGQLIMFAGAPHLRGYFRGSMRMLTNALFYGPGLGTRRPPPW